MADVAPSNFARFPTPGPDAEVLVSAPGSGPGHWAGASSAAALDARTFLVAYRVRLPMTRGTSIRVVSWTIGDEPVAVASVTKEMFGAESLERPALVRTAAGTWRLYVSCATVGTKHWWIESVDADDPSELAQGKRRMVFPGDSAVGVKDPVILAGPGGWHAWVCCHPLDVPGQEDRMTTALAVSPDGLTWHWRGTVLRPRPGTWDARGTRVTAVVPGLGAAYDGRTGAEQNFAERTGLAAFRAGARMGDLGPAVADRADPLAEDLVAMGSGPVATARYLDVVSLSEGRYRLFYEAPLPDGSHELRTQEVRA